MTSDSAATVRLTRAASPPSFADAANTSPRTTKATFLPSGESASSSKPLVSERCSTPGAGTAPRRSIASARARPLAVSSVQMPKSRSKATVFPSRAIEGHSTRPDVKSVSRRASPPATGSVQRFSLPLRSDMK